VHPADPAPQMALVRETPATGNFSQSGLTITSELELERALRSQMRGLTPTDRLNTREVEWTTSCNFCGRGTSMGSLVFEAT
jgi:hypothetical protein